MLKDAVTCASDIKLLSQGSKTTTASQNVHNYKGEGWRWNCFPIFLLAHGVAASLWSTFVTLAFFVVGVKTLNGGLQAINGPCYTLCPACYAG